MLDRSHNPWVYPAGIRERLLTPISSARLAPSLTCDIPLIDAVELRCEQGILIALSNHTLRPLDGVELKLKSDKPVTACAGCHARFDPPHARFDPPGFALESYDVIGGWRDFYRGTEGQKAPDFVRSFRSYLTPDEEFKNHVSFRDGQPVDASGELVDGRKFGALREYQALLDGELTAFSRNLANQLVVYATGAPVSFADRPAVEEILKRAGGTNPNLNELLHQVIQSPLFLNK